MNSMERSSVYDQITDMISVYPCNKCGKPMTEIKSSRPDEGILMYYCQECKSGCGVDDTFSEEDAFTWLEKVRVLYDKKKLRAVKCQSCSNDDIEAFTIEFEDGHFYVSCSQCGHRKVIGGQDLAEGTEASTDGMPTADFPEMVCDCGNDDLGLFRVQYNSAGTPELLTCFVCDSTYVGHFLSHVDRHDLEGIPEQPSRRYAEDDKPECGSEFIIGRTEISDIRQLHAGDHITWYRRLAYDHHAIVDKIRSSVNQISVIHYDGPRGKKPGTKGVIVKEWLTLDCVNDRIARQEYRWCYDAHEVLDRARSRIGESDYNLLLNNCEHFARWCKTGVNESGQVKSAVQKMKRGSSDSRKVEHDVRMISKMVEISKGKMVGLTFLGMTIAEVGHVSDDLKSSYKQMKDGNISKTEFARVSIERISEGIGAVAGSVAGSAVSIAIPLVGGLVGCTLGNLVGRAIGKVGGRNLASLVRTKQVNNA